MRMAGLQHAPIARNGLLHSHCYRFCLGIPYDDAISTFKQILLLAGSSQLFKIGLFFVGRYIEGLAQFEADGFIAWRVPNSVLAHKLNRSGRLFLVYP